MSSAEFEDRSINPRELWLRFGLGGAVFAVFLLLVAGYVVYTQFRIDVPAKHLAVLTKKTGIDLENGQEVAAR